MGRNNGWIEIKNHIFIKDELKEFEENLIKNKRIIDLKEKYEFLLYIDDIGFKLQYLIKLFFF